MDSVTLRSSFAICACILFTVAGQAAAQDEARIRDLTGSEITVEKLVELLSPDPEDAAALRARGLGVPGSPTKAACAKVNREQGARGIGTNPMAEVAITVNFAFNSAELASEASHDLDILAGALATPRLENYCFRIEGHADSVGSDAYNLQLSQRRADAVVAYLVGKRGIDADRLVAVGYGERQPIVSNDTEAGRAKNRRVQVANLGS